MIRLPDMRGSRGMRSDRIHSDELKQHWYPAVCDLNQYEIMSGEAAHEGTSFSRLSRGGGVDCRATVAAL